MLRPMAVKDCPCHSGARYTACCKPIHQGARATTPVVLMRSRYSAFALGLGTYLVESLASDHEDRRLPAEQLARELGRAKETQRFLGLQIWWSSNSEVLFFARVFERGKDLSFAELSTFVDEDGFRFQRGIVIPKHQLPNVDAMDRAAFLALSEALATEASTSRLRHSHPL